MDDQGAEVSPKREHTHSYGNLACRRCGEVVPATRPWHQYCSNRCRVGAGRDRQAARMRQMEGLIDELARVRETRTREA